MTKEIAIYLLNQKRQTLCILEQRYKMEIVICADDSIKNVAEFKLERVKSQKEALDEKKTEEEYSDDEPGREDNSRRNNRRGDRRKAQPEETKTETETAEMQPQTDENNNAESASENSEFNNRRGRRRDRRRDRRGRDRRRDRRERGNDEFEGSAPRENEQHKEKAETIILYNSHEDIKSNVSNNQKTDEKQGKTNWWRKLIG